ncbi:NAD binding domain of 6-phosphogluconate dehydrogenase-domain-containing protein [Cokeromyces recurvatus]|uniref:NAD binding domain of 6-phosphogluconate dehydrogenase-domain-containing protein n=1 Tax=Cokeromyces recurvatus TaxID=90255 RepID=UPI002221071A|nr:NAD binding domain of 6-phosphogluconate dehydrogenase-domain-containing protein [Cokeromyces recurvatus]KAI7899267.1 NAD binding domain of 6-phosphogluconate dehydrogenase-domain-containing protein [Cokeromyces recurvatus]
MSAPPQCAFIGLGAMGKNMAGHIANKLASMNYPPLLAYNRTQARTEELQKTHPIEIATSLEQVAKSADIIFSCILNDAAVQETIQTLLPHLKKGAILVESSTISPSLAKDLATQLSSRGAHYLAAPVMGPPDRAKSGDLTILMAGGDSVEIRQQVLPLLLNVIGKRVIELSYEDAAESLRLKLCGNFFITSMVEMIGEGMALGEAVGVGQDKVKELIDCVYPNSLLSLYATRMLNNTYRHYRAFPLSTAKKDVGHILHMAKEANAELPITQIFLEHANKAQEEQGDIDISGVVGCSREKAGLGFDL